jgi:hypothetical protein
MLHVNDAMLPWLSPPALLIVVVAAAVTPVAVAGAICVIVALALGYVALPLRDRQFQPLDERNDAPRWRGLSSE